MTHSIRMPAAATDESDDLMGQVAFITGAARGQGRLHAVELARRGVDIIGVDISEPVQTMPYRTATAADLLETARQVEEVGGRMVAREADVRELSALQAAVDAGVEHFGRLDIVIANAGVAAPVPTLEMSEQQWTETIDINLNGAWRTVRAAVPSIISGGRGGSVVLVSSLAAVKANLNVAHYSASKSGLVMLAKVLAKELAPQWIRVNTLHPTIVETDMILKDATYRLFRPDLENPTRADFEQAAQTLHALPVPYVQPIDVTRTVLHLVSAAGRFITGSTQFISAGGELA